MADEPAAHLFTLTPAAEAQRRIRFSKRLPVQRCRRILARCRDLTPAEIAHRLQRIVGRRTGAGDAVSVSVAPAAGTAADGLDRRFLLGPRDRERVLALLAARPQQRARVATTARRLLDAGADVFDRVIPLDPARLDWHADPVTGRRLWPDARLNEGDAVAATRTDDGTILTDVKYTWETSRHQFLPAIAIAGHVETDPASLARVAALVDGWIAENPRGRGVNWSSVLEVGVRAISWLWTLPFMLDTPAVDSGFRARWLASLGDHYAFLRDNLSLYTDRSNHLIGEATALWLIASVFPELPDAGPEAARALDVLAVEIERQVTSDGVSREQAVGYHCFVLEFYLQVAAVARRLDLPLPEIVTSRVTAMLTFLHRLLGAGGALPSIGDGDDGLGLPNVCALDARERATALLDLGARLFGRPEWAARAPVPHAFAWIEIPAAREAAPTPSAPGAAPGSVLLREGGYAFLEAVADDGGHRQLIFDVGALGYLPNAAHEHADALSILVRINDTLVLGDPGTGTYTASPTVRNGFRGTAAHNTIVVDDLDQADVLDTFKWLNLTETELLAWEPGSALDWVAARHDGYRRLREPVVHTRAVLFARPDYWIVVDRIEGRGIHRVRRRFHVPPDVDLTVAGPQCYEARSPSTGDGVRLTFVPVPGQATLSTTIESSPWSSGYGRWGTSTRLSSDGWAGPVSTFLTLITPVIARQSLHDVACTPIEGGGPANETVLCRIRARGGGEEDVLSAARVEHGVGDARDELVLVRAGDRPVRHRLSPFGEKR